MRANGSVKLRHVGDPSGPLYNLSDARGAALRETSIALCRALSARHALAGILGRFMDNFVAWLQTPEFLVIVGFHLFVILMLALDLGVFQRKAHAVSMKEAGIWSAVWVALAFVFAFLIWQYWHLWRPP